MTSDVVEYDPADVAIEEMLESIFRSPELKSYWERYNEIIRLDTEHCFSTIEKAHIAIVGTLYLDTLTLIGDMTAEERKEAMFRPSSPYSRLKDMSKQISDLEEKAKVRAEKHEKDPKYQDNPFKGIETAELETKDEKISFKREKKKEETEYEEIE